MAVEVELKAWVTNPDELRERLRQLGTPQRRYVKEDRYFGTGSTPEDARYRLRFDDNRWTCTFKKKEIHDGIEENHETEFDVSDADAFEYFLASLGLQCIITKRKEGESFRVDGVLAELSYVDHVGWFVELEVILSDETQPNAVADARAALMQLLQRLGLTADSLESRSYNRMIYEATSQGHVVSRDSV
ncbi:MAG: class IV adenylate cyclase [Alkalispirochaeta sp.]